MLWSVLLRVVAQKTTLWLVEIFWQPIRSFYSMVFEATTRNKMKHIMWKSMKNCARKWCLFVYHFVWGYLGVLQDVMNKIWFLVLLQSQVIWQILISFITNNLSKKVAASHSVTQRLSLRIICSYFVDTGKKSGSLPGIKKDAKVKNLRSEK